MQVWNLPDFFEHYQHKITSNVGIEVIHNQNTQKVDVAKVRLNSNLLFILLAGSKDVFFPDKKIRIRAGEALFLSQGNYLMSEKLVEVNQYESIMLFFDNAVARELSRNLLKNSDSSSTQLRVNSIKVGYSEHSIAFATSLKNYFAQPATHRLDEMLKIKLQELFYLICQGSYESEFLSFLKSLQNKKALSLEQLMQECYKETFSLDQLAFLAGYSLSTFKRKFKEIFNDSPSRWIQARRLQEAQFLLQNTPKNINEVGYELGFESISHFIRVFKNQFGVTPKEFQHQVQAK